MTDYIQALEENRQLQDTVDCVLEARFKKGRLAGKSLQKWFDEKKPTQIRNLENLIYSTRRYSEIYNFIENQTGKDNNKRTWNKVTEHNMTVGAWLIKE